MIGHCLLHDDRAARERGTGDEQQLDIGEVAARHAPGDVPGGLYVRPQLVT